MSQRLFDTANWLWCLLVLNCGIWSTVKSVTVRSPPTVPSTIEAQAKFFQDFFSVQLSPYKIEFGHVCEDPNTWEQRYEKKDFKNHRDMGKVRWGDKKGGYGEHYWDLNHAGHTGDHESYDDSDDGSYRENPSETYNDSDETRHNYDTGDYNPEITSHYEESDRKKRAHGKIKTTTPKNEIQDDGEEEEEEEKEIQPKQKPKLRRPQNKGDYKPKLEDIYTDEEQSEELINRRTTVKPKRKLQEKIYDDIKLNREKNNIVLVINQKEKKEEPPKQTEPKRFVPYEGEAGVRQYARPEIASVASTRIPRLFLEASTGHVVDRATGQAYVLQPLPHVNYS